MTGAVIDAWAFVAYLLREESSEEIERYLLEGVFSVELLLKETANALLEAQRNGRIS